MNRPSPHHRALAFAAGVALSFFSGWAGADPPSRVARLGYMAGTVSFSPAGEVDWVRATINRPLTTGDRLWSAVGARAEIQVGGAVIRMSSGTSVSVLNLDDRMAQVQLTQGSLNVRVRRLERDQAFEVDTPNLAFTLRQPGEYRIDVDPDGSATTIAVRKGQGEADGEDASYVIDSRQPYRFTGTGLRDYQPVDAQQVDDFDRWASDRDRAFDNSGSARYVSPDVVGFEDLDANGTWRVDATYGNIWIPNRVAAGWAPYRDGHWAWVDPWGWTWVDDAPWGFAVSHYGRWANVGGSWGWVPGPVRTHAYYAPALVVFVGGDNFRLTISGGNVGGVAWFPLGPREVYRPSYPVSRGYFENVNRSNTVINNTVINNYYSNMNVTNVVYANRRVPGAVVAVPTTAFVQSQPVSRAAVHVPPDAALSASVAVTPHVAPTDASVRGAAAQADKPPARVFERPVVARTAPPAAHVGFAAQQPQLAATPGQPLGDAARKELRPAATAPVAVVKVIAPTQEAARRMGALPTAPGVEPVGKAHGKPDERKAPEATAVPAAPMQAVARSRTTFTAPQAEVPRPRETPEQRAKGEARAEPVAPPAGPTPTRELAQPRPATSPPATAPAPHAAAPAPQVAVPPPHVAAPAPPPRLQAQRGKAEPAAPAAPQVEAPATRGHQQAPPAKPEAPAAAPKAEPQSRVAAPESPLPQTQRAPKAQPHGEEPKPAAVKANLAKKDSGEQKREEEAPKQQGKQ